MRLGYLLKKIILFLFPLICVVGLGWYLRTESDFFLVRDVPISVEFSESQRAFVHWKKEGLDQKLKSLKGVNIWQVNLHSLQKDLQKEFWIQEVLLQRKFPDQVKASIVVSPMAFLFVDKKNRIYPVSSQGKMGAEIPPTKIPIAPLVRRKKIVQDSQLRQKVIGLLEKIPDLGPLRKENRAQLDFTLETGLKILLVDDPVEILLGSENLQKKALKVIRVYNYLKSQKQEARVIDARFTKKVLVRPRKGS